MPSSTNAGMPPSNPSCPGGCGRVSAQSPANAGALSQEHASRSRAPEPGRASLHALRPAPHGCQLARAVQLRRHHGIAAVRLHAIARRHRHERWRHNNAIMPQLDKLAIQPIPAWACLAARMQTTSAGAKLLHQLADMIRTVRNRAPVTDLSPTVALRNRDRNRRLMDIQSDEHAMPRRIASPFLRLGTDPSGATLRCRVPRQRPPSQSPQGAGCVSEVVEIRGRCNLRVNRHPPNRRRPPPRRLPP